MKKILLVTIVFFLAAYVDMFAQQEPQLTHYMFNKLIYNPAVAGGSGEYVTITGLLHRQWTDFTSPEGEVAPQTQTASIDGAIRPFADKNMYLGLGFNFLNDKEAFYVTNQFMLSGAFHFIPKFGGSLSLGVNLGMINKSIGPKWNAANPGDPLLPGTVSNSGFDAGIGAYYNYGDKWYVGVSALHLPATKLDWVQANYTVDRTYFITGGYNIDINQNPDLEIQPSVLIKMDQAKTSLGATGLFLYKQRFWGGIGLRTENATAVALLVGLYILPDLKLGYSYDVATQNPTPFGGTHEIFFSYRFKIHFITEPPVFDRTPRWL